ncbi:hypothetical protein [Terrabacter sp. 2TAF16]|uniref:hypothetical protein n=1 Tax=Terrabacter sp. 2TAF16 TaxID=3233008 RepID=UPI003F9467F0
MADAGAARAWLARWWVPLTIFAASRIVDAVFLALAAEDQVALNRTRADYYVYDPTQADPGYSGIVSNWDAQWYRRIATEGYELSAPGGSTADTRNTLWTWAFPPAYPMIVRLVMALTSLSFPVAATIVSCLAGAGAMVLMYRLVIRTGGPFLAGVTVLFSSFFISAPLLQIGYSEALALLFLMAALNFMVDWHYLWATAAVLALSMTRLVTLPFLLVVIVHAYLRYRREGAFWRTERAGAASLALAGAMSIFGLFSWMLLASVFIGTDAGMERSAGQRSFYLGWFEDAYHLFGPAGPIIVGCFLLLVAGSMLVPSASVWAPELRAWSAAYPAFLLAMTPILPAVMRYLLLTPTLPVLLAGTPRQPTRRTLAWVGFVLVVLVLCQRWYAANIIVVWTEAPRPAP